VSQDRIPPDRFHFAWLIVWTVWGAIVGLLVYLFDREAIAGLNWLSAGIFIGTCGIQLLKPLATPFHDWYERLGGGERYLDRMMEVMLEGHEEEISQEELRERLEKYQQSREFQQYLENSLYGVTLAVAPLFGLFYGILGGGVLGAVCPISPELHVTSGRGAVLGIMLGPLFISFIASATCAVMHPVPKYSLRSVDRSRRLTLLVSPVLVVPAVFHCLKEVATLHKGPAS
jgi:hypothetical protein